MEKDNIIKFIVNMNASIIDAMKKIDDNAKGVIFVVDKDNRLIGAISDGDIRRWLIKTGDLNSPIVEIMNKSPKYVYDISKENASKIFEKDLVHVIPVINNDHIIVDFIFENQVDNSHDLSNSLLKSIPIIIMAGGKGTRLYPYTKILPKPLIPINDIPILERVINGFRKYSADNIYISVNYKKEMIKSYFSELNVEYDIKYIEEDKPLGTAGSIGLIKDKLKGNVIVTNCDILVKTDFGNVLKYHEETDNAITIVAAMKESTIPYGVIHTKENGIVGSIEEKPTIPFIINTGMYVVKSEYFDLIPNDCCYHMTDLVNELISMKKPVGIYPVSEDSFLDMGEFAEMQRMEEKLKESLQ